MQHALFMALLAQKWGERKALAFGDAHEKDWGHGYIDTEKDLLNNDVGAALGAKYPDLSLYDLAEILANATDRGYLTCLNADRTTTVVC